MTDKILNSRQKGQIGEEIASKFLIKRGFYIVEKNYLKKWGEIDIVAKKENVIHFIEVKSVTIKKSFKSKEKDIFSKSINLTGSVNFRPEENVHVLKQKRLRRVIQIYLLERKHGLGAEFFFHIIVVYMNTETRRAKVAFIENIIL